MKILKSRKFLFLSIILLVLIIICLLVGIIALFLGTREDSEGELEREDRVVDNEQSSNEQDTEESIDYDQLVELANTPIISSTENYEEFDNFVFDLESSEIIRIDSLDSGQRILAVSEAGKYIVVSSEETRESTELHIYQSSGQENFSRYKTISKDPNSRFGSALYIYKEKVFYTLNRDTQIDGQARLVTSLMEFNIENESTREIWEQTFEKVNFGDQPGEAIEILGISSDGETLYDTDYAGGGFLASVSGTRLSDGENIFAEPLAEVATYGFYDPNSNSIIYISNENSNLVRQMSLNDFNDSIIFDANRVASNDYMVNQIALRGSGKLVISIFTLSDENRDIVYSHDMSTRNNEVLIEKLTNGRVNSSSGNGRYLIIDSYTSTPNGEDPGLRIFDTESNELTSIPKLSDSADMRFLGWTPALT